MKKIIFIFLSVITFWGAHAQSRMIKEVFRLLPAANVYNLTNGTRDSMLQGKTYYPADNSVDEIAAYNYGVSAEVKDYLYVSLSFETAQRATGMIEIRSFAKANGEKLIVVSQTGGVLGVAYSQHELSYFTYDNNKNLVPYKKAAFPTADESLFMKPGIPDSVKKIIRDNANMCFDFSSEKPTLDLNSNYISDHAAAAKWLKGDRIYFEWINDRFLMHKIGPGALSDPGDGW
jgi:hypothetical protein